jgi:creatinine amidohydrolase
MGSPRATARGGPGDEVSRRKMKPPTVFLGEMTNPEVEAFLQKHHTVIVPTGATEQHGPHAPLLTDVLIPQEIARRIASRVGALVAPPINYALSYPHVGFTGLVHVRIPTFMAIIEDLCVAFATSGFKRIIFLNGHYDNTYAIAYACANAAEKLSKTVKAFPVNYWDGMTAADVDEFSGLKNGLHANAAETSAILAINPKLVDLEQANAEFPPFPDYTVNTGPVHTAFFFTSPGSVYWATKSGTWGDARKSTPEMGERYIEVGVRSTLAVLENIEKTFEAMPPR